MTSWSGRRAPWSIATVSALASISSLWNGFTYDDLPVIVNDARVHSLAHWWTLFSQGYWPAELHGGLYRPITILLFAAQWVTGNGAPIVFHLVSVAAYVAVSLVVWLVARELLTPAAAWLAAAVFAVHPVHVEAIGGAVGQAELFAALAVLGAVLLYLRCRRRGGLTGGAVALLCALYAAALLCKEHTVVLPGLLALVELCLRRAERLEPRPSAGAGRSPAKRATAATPTPTALSRRGLATLYVGFAVVLVFVAAVRSAVIGAAARPLPDVAFWHLDLAGRFFTMLGASWQWARLLVWPAKLIPVYSPPYVPVLTGFAASALPGLVASLLIAGTVVAGWRRAPIVALGAGWIIVALVPVSNVIVPTGVIVAERTLFLPSVGLALLVGAVAAVVLRRLTAKPFPESASAALRAAVILVLGLALVRSAVHERVWADDAHLVNAAIAAEPSSYKIDDVYARWALAQGHPEQAGQWLVRAVQLYPYDPTVHVDMGDLLMRVGRYDQAARAFKNALGLDPVNADARSGLVVCLLNDHQFDQARQLAEQGVAIGAARDAFQSLLKIDDSVEGAPPPAPVVGTSAAPPPRR
jgi:hypothetical protein